MIIPPGQSHMQFYNRVKYTGEKITSRYEGVEINFYSPCCDETIINWVVKKDGKIIIKKPFTEEGERQAHEGYLKLRC